LILNFIETINTQQLENYFVGKMNSDIKGMTTEKAFERVLNDGQWKTKDGEKTDDSSKEEEDEDEDGSSDEGASNDEEDSSKEDLD
jgi:hypothetical protein